MNIRRLFQPKPTLSEQEVTHGLYIMTWEGVVSMGFSSIAGGAILAAFALALGANNAQIGILAAIPPLTQPLQIAALILVERMRRRKILTVVTWFLAQALWIPIALIPVLIDVPSAAAISALLTLIAFRSILSAFTGCAWNSWIKDLVPQAVLGRFFARRQALANMAGIVFGLGVAFFVDYWQKHAATGSEILGYTLAILVGTLILGLASPLLMSLIPEPLMQPPDQAAKSPVSTLKMPFRDRNYRHLLWFLLLWGFTLNLAMPFFTVYMLRRLGLSLSSIMILYMIGLAANISFLRVWGSLADRFSNKAVLSICASLYIMVVLGWVFTTMPERYFLTIPLLVILHIFGGIAGAGVGLTTGTISMKMAPQGQATSYLAVAGLVTSVGAASASLLGGLFANFFSVRTLSFNFTWIDPTQTFNIGVVNLGGLDFLFGLTFVLGLFTLNTLTAIREEGEVGKEVILDTLTAPMREVTRPISSIPGVNFLNQFPYGYLKRFPVSGLDIAIGVTAYQLADSIKVVTSVAAKGRRVTSRIARVVENNLTQLLKSGVDVQQHGIEIARHAARGVTHAFGETDTDVKALVSPAVVGIVRALRDAEVDPQDAIRGASQGIIQGTIEKGADIGTVTRQTIAAAKEIAAEVDLSEETTVARAMEGALEAARAAGEEAVVEIIESLSDEILPSETREQENKGN